jgi:hypothetical protein
VVDKGLVQLGDTLSSEPEEVVEEVGVLALARELEEAVVVPQRDLV